MRTSSICWVYSNNNYYWCQCMVEKKSLQCLISLNNWMNNPVSSTKLQWYYEYCYFPPLAGHCHFCGTSWGSSRCSWGQLYLNIVICVETKYEDTEIVTPDIDTAAMPHENEHTPPNQIIGERGEGRVALGPTYRHLRTHSIQFMS